MNRINLGNKTVKLALLAMFLVSIISLGTIGMADNSNIVSDSQITDSQSLQIDTGAGDINTIDQITAQKKIDDHATIVPDRIGKIEKTLSDKILASKPTDKFKVAIWVKDDGIIQISKEDATNDTNFSINVANINAGISAKQKPLKDFLNLTNIKILYASTFAPVVFAEVTKSDIQNIVARNDVTLLQSVAINQPMISSTVPSVLAPPVWNYVAGGVKVAVVEPEGIAFANPYIKDGTYYNPSNPNIGSHATGIAGVISSINSTYKGVVWNGPILMSANSPTWGDNDLVAATDWALANKAKILSNSWGFNNAGDFNAMVYYEDYLVTHYPYPTIVFSAGDCGDCAFPYNRVATPSNAYNVISVGSFDDMGTGYNWEDDVMSLVSAYGAKSSHGDRELPEVNAVGCHNSSRATPATYVSGIISTTISSPWIGNLPLGQDCGTSFSAPEVTGEASLLISAQPNLSIWPEAVRAIIMASADHNVQDNNINRWKNKMLAPAAGNGINVLEAYKIASKGRGIGYDFGGLFYNSGSKWFGPNINANQGQKVRVIFTWDSTSPGYSGTDKLKEDLDLSIQRWTGTSWVNEPRAGQSTSYDNNYEIVEFNAPATGKYRAQINKYRWDDQSVPTYYGYAAYVK